MTGFIDKVGNLAKKAADKTGDMVEIGMLNSKIGAQRQNISSMKERMGGIVFEQFRQGIELSEELTQFCQQIEEIEAAIDKMQKDIQDLKE
jgi:cob(I)alamin adenosyltransferase